VKRFIRTISCLALVVLLGAGAVSIVGSQPAPVDAHPACATREVPLDEGYGVTRVELREICER
jgi:hypothetical protein